MSPQPDLESLYDAHADALYAFALSLSRNPADAADTVQDVFVKIARRPEAIARARDLRAYLFRLTYTTFVDRVRSRTSRARTRDEFAKETVGQFQATADPDTDAFRNRLEEALGELPEDQRAVVHLKLWGGLTFDAIARTLDIPANTAASRYRYGVDKLRNRLRPVYEELE